MTTDYPIVGADKDLWGGKLNDVLARIEAKADDAVSAAVAAGDSASMALATPRTAAATAQAAANDAAASADDAATSAAAAAATSDTALATALVAEGSETQAALSAAYVGKGEPWVSQVNRVYVSPAGADTNDGLSASTPFATFQAAFDYLALQGPILQGFWEVVAAAGTYPMTAAASFTTPSINRVVIRGPVAGHPNVPTAIIDGAGGAAYSHGLRAGNVGVRVEFRDLKAINFTAGGGDTTRIGFVGENEADVLFTNVHATGATWCGAYAFNTIRARVSGGIFDGCRSGFIANDTQATIANSIVRNSTESGVYWSRGSQGHCDYVTFEDNAIGLVVAENSRVDTVANNFKRNSYGIRTRSGGLYGEGGEPNIFNVGTADAQLQADVQSFAFSGDTAELDAAQQYIRVAHDRTTRTLTDTTAQTTMASPYTLPARRLTGAGKQMRVHVLGVFTAITAGSVVTVAIGGMAVNVTVPGAATNAAFELEVTLLEVTGGYRAIAKLSQGLNQHRFATTASGFTASSAQAVEIKATPAATGDSIAIYRTDVYLLG